MKYARAKATLNPGAGTPPDNVDLKVTGAFHRGMITKLNQDTIEIMSTDCKEKKLIGQYGEKVFGLNEENQAIYNQQHFAPEFMRRFQDATGL